MFKANMTKRNQEISKMYNDNHSVEFIAEQYGLSIRRTKRIIRRMNKIA